MLFRSMGTLLVRHRVTPETVLGTAGTSASATSADGLWEMRLAAMLFTQRIERSNVNRWLIARKTGFPDDFGPARAADPRNGRFSDKWTPMKALDASQRIKTLSRFSKRTEL